MMYEEARRFIEIYEHLDETEKSSISDIHQRIKNELCNPTEKIEDDPTAVLVSMGYFGFTTTLSISQKLKTFGMASCLTLVTKGVPIFIIGKESYMLGSLSHVASTFDTEDLVSRIIRKYSTKGVFPEQIDFEIYATGCVDTDLLGRTKRIIHNKTGQNPTEDIRLVHSGSLLYDFSLQKSYEIPELNLHFPEYKKDIYIPAQYSRYILVADPRTHLDARKLYSYKKDSDNVEKYV